MNTLRIAFAFALFAAWGGAQAHIQTFTGTLAPEVTGATGSGSVSVEYEDEFHYLTIATSFTGLSGDVTLSHIHCCVPTAGAGTAGVALGNPLLTDFPLGGKSGDYLHLFILTDSTLFGGAFLAANGGTAASAEAALIAGLLAGKAYLNIHTSTFGSGEIRAFLNLAPVPEHETYALMIAGLGLLGFAARSRPRH